MVYRGIYDVRYLQYFPVNRGFLSKLDAIFEPSYWEWQRLILAFIYLKRIGQILFDRQIPTFDQAGRAHCTLIRDKADLVMMLVMKFTDSCEWFSPVSSNLKLILESDMATDQSGSTKDRVDYCCTEYNPTLRDTALDTFEQELAPGLASGGLKFTVAEHSFQRFLRSVSVSVLEISMPLVM